MIITISFVLLLIGLVAARIATGRMPILDALAAALLGFCAAGTAIAPPINSTLTTCLGLLGQITSQIT